MSRYTYDHIHLRSADNEATAEYYRTMFGAEISEGVQADGQRRFDLDINGLRILISRVAKGEYPLPGPSDTHLGLDHFGLRVEDLDEAAAELKRLGAEFTLEPRTIRPGVKIAFVRAPEGVRIELVERS